jgi:hypothetical protein
MNSVVSSGIQPNANPPAQSAPPDAARSPAGELRRVRNGVGLALLLKLLALLLLFFLFFGPGRDTHGAHDAFFHPIVPQHSGD